MSGNTVKIVVIDAQGGGIGKQLITELRKRSGELRDSLPAAEIIAIGTNQAASASMLKAGADHAATGENPVLVNCRDADYILGPIGIALADAMFGEITPAISAAVGSSRAKKILIPMNNCGTYVAGVGEMSVRAYISEAVALLMSELAQD